MFAITFHFNDPRVQLRLAALLTCMLLVVCLGLLEFRPGAPRRWKAVTLVCILLLVGAVGYALFRLKGA